MKLKTILITLLLVFLWVSTAFSQGFFRTAVHHYIHAGNYFTFSHIAQDVANGDSSLITIHTGDRMVHFLASVSAGGQTEVHLQNDVDVSSNGTELECFNYNRNSDRQSLTRAFNGSVVNSYNATLTRELVIGGTATPSRVGGVSSKREEFVLAKNSTYLVNATNTSGSAVDISISGSFYEMDLR